MGIQGISHSTLQPNWRTDSLDVIGVRSTTDKLLLNLFCLTCRLQTSAFTAKPKRKVSEQAADEWSFVPSLPPLLPLLPHFNLPLTVDLQILLSFSNNFYRSLQIYSNFAKHVPPIQKPQAKQKAQDPIQEARPSAALGPVDMLQNCSHASTTGPQATGCQCAFVCRVPYAPNRQTSFGYTCASLSNLSNAVYVR